MAYNRKDFYFKEAKKKDYAARSIFKLEEMDAKYKILSKGMKVLDLGAAPGSWAQYTSRAVGPRGRVFGIDLQDVRVTLPNAVFIKADLRDVDIVKEAAAHGIEAPFDCVLSDMAPRTTGIKFTDQARSLELCELALDIAERELRPGGNFVVKLFHGEGFEEYRDRLKRGFNKVEIIRPKSTRKESKEVFFVAKGRKAVKPASKE